MAKIKKTAPKQETTSDAEDEDHQDGLEEGATLSFGQKSETLSEGAEEIDPFLKPPSVMPNKPGFMPGQTLCGIYQETRRVFSNKFKAGKKDAAGNKYRDLHMMKDANNGQQFTIFSVGQLGAFFKGIQAGSYVEITYVGMSDKPLREGESNSHDFTFKGKNPDGTKLTVNWNSKTDTAQGASSAAPMGAAQAH